MKPKEIIHLLSQASAQLGPCGNEACKFFIKLAQEALEQQDMPEYGTVINNLFEFFDCKHDVLRVLSDVLLQQRSCGILLGDVGFPFFILTHNI